MLIYTTINIYQPWNFLTSLQCFTCKLRCCLPAYRQKWATLAKFSFYICCSGFTSGTSKLYVLVRWQESSSSLYLKFESLRKCRVPTSWMCCGFVHAAPSVQLLLQPGCDTLCYECSTYPNSSLFTFRGSKYLLLGVV